ncbi:MAG: putative DNA binding domain-containing protein [Rubrivivax sp.]|nr:putative DNA binding domain-containing protein [Rubrivivax sp.]
MSAEDQQLEWKAVWRDDHLKWVCAFANAQGGTLVIGRDDAGRLVGVPNARKLLEDLPNKARDLLGVVVQVNLRQEGGQDLLEVVTPAYPTPISYRGHYYQRSGSTLQELKGAALDHFLLRRYGRTWDGAPLPGVALADLSPGAFAQFRTLATRSGRLDEAALAEPDAALLDRLRLTEGGYLKRAAVLLFHPDPLRHVGGAFVKIGFFREAAELVYHDEVNGDLFTQVRQTLDLLLTKYLKAAVSYQDIVRVERFPVPREALREAVLNALVHRDYMVPAPVQVRVHDDQLVLWNPAVLPEGWTAETLLRPHASQPHNPDVANAFFRAGEIEAWGRGIERIFSACRQAGVPEPRLQQDAGGLWMTFPFDAAYLGWVQRAGGSTSAPVPHGEVTPEVTPEVARLLGVIRGEMSRSELMAALRLSDEKHFRQQYQQVAVSLGLLEMTIPDKPRSRLQRYRLTPRGKAVAASLAAQTGGPR